MKPGVIILSRMNSTRLPGKALADICGKPLLSRVIERLTPLISNGVQIVVATSRSWHDDPIEELCREEQVACFRGSLNHVADRILDCANHFQFDRFARVNGDSPLIEPALLKQAFEIAEDKHFDFVTNLAPRGFPYGVAVEVFRAGWMRSIRANQTLLLDPEHVTKRFYNNLHLLRYYNIAGEYEHATDCRLTVDTNEDLDWLRRFVSEHEEQWPNVSLEEAIDHRRALPTETQIMEARLRRSQRERRSRRSAA